MLTKNEKEIIFVYNADAGMFNLLSDIAKKAFKTDGTCSLCDLTNDTFSMKNDWKEFVATLPYKTTFLHKDEFQNRFPETSVSVFPVVCLLENEALRELVGAEMIDNISGLEDLKKTITDALE